MRLQIATIAFSSLGALMCVYAEEVPQPARPVPKSVPVRPAAGVPASYEDMHDQFVEAFSESEGFGPSRIPRLKKAKRPQAVRIGSRNLTITSFELIGIAKHNPPVIHLHYQHPMGARENGQPAKQSATTNDVPQNARPKAEPAPETRALTGFEVSALAMLREGGELGLSVDQDNQDRLVVAPIRATQQCVKCHAGSQAGDLLGAFTYRLGTAPTVVPQAPGYAGEVPILGR